MRDGGTGGRGLLGSAGGRRSGRGRAGGHRSRGGGRGLGYDPRAKAAAGGRAACAPRDRASRLARRGRGTVAGRPPALAVVLFLVAAVTGAINANTAAKTAPGRAR